jgi:hypothetical protein
MRPAAECPDRRNEPTRPESPVRGDHLRAGGRGREPRISGAGATPSKSSVLIKYERAHEAPLACGRIPRYADRPFDRLARMEEVASQGPDKTPPGLTELFAHWDRHAGYYGDVECAAAMAREDSGWRNVITYVLPLQKNGEQRPKIRFDYGDVVIVREQRSLADAKSLLQKLVIDGCLQLQSTPELKLKATPDIRMVRRVGSHQSRFPNQFSASEFPFHLEPHYATIPNGFMCAGDLPLYPYAHAAIQDILGLRIFNQGGSEIIALAPDYRSRIVSVHLSKTSVQVKIATSDHLPTPVIGKAYIQNLRGGKQHFDLLFENGVSTVQTDGSPRDLLIVLMTRDSGEIIDEWSYNSGMPVASGVVIETTNDDVELLISGGESETVEFKEKMPTPEVLATIISGFANSGGGRLLVGVKDDGETIGLDTVKTQDDITRTLDHHCVPSPPFQVDGVTIGERRVMVIAVPQGGDKPYVTEKGIYIRSGATTRRVSRYELDQMYTNRSSQIRL